MRAVRLKEFGGPEMLVVGEAPEPVSGPGQALIEVAFSNITFVETQFRAGGFDPFSTELPTIPGNGVGGVVSSVGAGVDGDLIGKVRPPDKGARRSRCTPAMISQDEIAHSTPEPRSYTISGQLLVSG